MPPKRPARPARRKSKDSPATAEAIAQRKDYRRRAAAVRENRRLLRKWESGVTELLGELDSFIDRELRRRKLISISQEEYDQTFGRIRELETALAEARSEADAMRLEQQYGRPSALAGEGR